MEKGSFMSGRRLKVGFMMLVCTVMLSFGVFGEDVFAENTGGLIITGGTEGTDWEYDPAHKEYSINHAGDYTITMKPGVTETADRIINFADNGEVNLTLNSVHLNGGRIKNGYDDLNLKLVGTNIVSLDDDSYPGIEDKNEHNISIFSEQGGSLDITAKKIVDGNLAGINVTNCNLSIGGNARVTITGFVIGIAAEDLAFKGGSTVALGNIQAIYCGSLSFDGNYKHKNYYGSSATDRAVIDDAALIAKVKGRAMYYEKYAAIVSVNTITCDPAGGDMPPGSFTTREYSVLDDDIKLGQPIREGYTFIGWTGTDLTEPTVDVTIPTGSTGDRIYTANWHEDRPNYPVLDPSPTFETKMGLQTDRVIMLDQDPVGVGLPAEKKPTTVRISNKKVAKVKYDKKNGQVVITPLEPGYANITVKRGKATETIYLYVDSEAFELPDTFDAEYKTKLSIPTLKKRNIKVKSYNTRVVTAKYNKSKGEIIIEGKSKGDTTVEVKYGNITKNIAVHADARTKTLKVPKNTSIKVGKSKTISVTANPKWSITKEDLELSLEKNDGTITVEPVAGKPNKIVVHGIKVGTDTVIVSVGIGEKKITQRIPVVVK